MSKECIFCKLARGEIPLDKIYEDEHILSFLDINLISPGHTLVITKEHFERFLDIPGDLACNLIKAVQKIANMIIKAVDADGYNLIVNEGKAAEKIVPHFHLHIIPRFEGDPIRYTHPPINYKEGQKEEILEKIKKLLK